MCTAAVEDDCLISYSISWSTQANRFTGIVRPRALAVFRLMMNWYLVGCGTGSSATRAQLLALMPAAFIIGPHLSISD
jgi:hypothetical protein